VTHADTELETRPRAARGAAGAEPTVNGVSGWRADHEDVLEQLSEYLDGSLSPAESERIQQHLDGCERCQAFYKTLGQVVTATRDMPAEELPEQTRRRLIDDTLSVAS
jgi:hypothetical protein